MYQSQDAVFLRIDHKGVKISQLDKNHANIPSLLVFTDLGVCPEKKGSRYTDLQIYRKDPHPAARLHLVAVQAPVLQLLLKMGGEVLIKSKFTNCNFIRCRRGPGGYNLIFSIKFLEALLSEEIVRSECCCSLNLWFFRF